MGLHLTVEEALRRYPLNRGKLVAGAKGLKRIIRSVNIIDSPDVFNWAKNGDLLFMADFLIKDEPNHLVDLLKKLDERGSAALAIRLGQFMAKIPDQAIAEAEHLDFPLIELPFEFAYSDQVNLIIRDEIDRRTKRLLHTMDKQKHLIRFAIHPPEHPVSHLPMIGEILGYPMALVGVGGHLLYADPGLPAKELVSDWPWEIKVVKQRGKIGWQYRIPLIHEGECCGFLLVVTGKEKAIREEESLFRQAAELVAAQLNLWQDDIESAAGHRAAQLLERYLTRRITPELFLKQARSILNLNDRMVYVCVKTCVNPAGRERSSAAESVPAVHRWRAARRELNIHPKLAKYSVHHLVINDALISVIGVPETEARHAALPAKIGQIFSEVLAYACEPNWCCYVSKAKNEPEDILDAYLECESASEVGTGSGGSPRVLLYADLELNHLFSFIPREVMAKYCINLLKPLLSKDNAYIREMLDTLEAYFEHDGQINAIAKKLFVHRNTVLYRMEKISELLGLDFRKTGDLLKLKLALTFRQQLMSEQYSTDQAVTDDRERLNRNALFHAGG